MKKQILFIGWWEAFENFYDKKFIQNKLDFYNRYFDFNPFWEKSNNWKDYLSFELESTHEFIKMYRPMSDSAIYDFWKLSFEKTLYFMNDDLILIWHSLWAIFLVKYFCENPEVLKKFKKIFFISTPLADSKEEVLWSFNIDKNLINNILPYQSKFVFIHSLDDEIVSNNDFYEYKKLLPNSEFCTFNDYGHFIFNTEFPELIKLIKKIDYE